VDGTTPQWYDIVIRQVRYNTANDTRSMVIEVVDEDLLSVTGGIVQGMSGSPIVQNGKLVGAVTHVLVNDPTRGYAVFAQTMLETANQAADEQAMKDAS
jgi:stage IV sporulation protein B